MQDDLQSYLKDMRQERLYAAFNEWFNKEVDKARLTMPAGYKSAN